MQDDDFSLFTRQMHGIRRLQVDQADTGKPRADRQLIERRRQQALQTTSSLQVDGLSDLFVIDVGAEDALYWGRDGLQDSQLRKLKAGQVAFEGSLDLHGMSVEKARKTSGNFSPKPPAWKCAACASPTARPRASMAASPC